MSAVDFIICFFADSPSLRRIALDKLKGNTLVWTPSVSGRKYREFVASHGNSVLQMFNGAKKSASDTLGRVAVLGFSEGCQGVGAVLNCSDASSIDTVIACDGIHTQYTDPATKSINPANLGQYISFAKAAIEDGRPSSNPDGRVIVITHSSIRPPYASTTETAQVIWYESTKSGGDLEGSDCGFDCPAAVTDTLIDSVVWPNEEFPNGMSLPGSSKIDPSGYTSIRPSAAETNFMPSAPFTWRGLSDGLTVRRNANGLHIYGWSYDTQNKTKDPTGNRDHVFQAQMVLPYMAKAFLVDRWNPTCSGTSGLGMIFENEIAGSYEGLGAGETCEPGHGRRYSSGSAPGPLKNPYPIGVGVPLRSGSCPVSPGQVIVGRPGDPCWIPGVPIPSKEPGTPQPLYADGIKVAALACGVAFGAAALTAIMHRKKTYP